MQIFTMSTEPDPLTGISRNVERCPKCNLTNQNFLIIPNEEIPLLGCFRCGTVFIQKRFLTTIDFKSILQAQIASQSAAEAAVPDDNNVPPDDPDLPRFGCPACHKDCKTGAGLAAHLKSCEAFGG